MPELPMQVISPSQQEQLMKSAAQKDSESQREKGSNLTLPAPEEYSKKDKDLQS